ncbi:MAG: preprotein translocase subunit SecE [Candidatus Paceibacteria bacterium]
MKKITNYFKDTLAEMKHVKWPTQNQTVVYTLLIIAICAITAVFLGLFDYTFSRGIDAIVNQF